MELKSLRAWFDSTTPVEGRGFDWARLAPYVALHLGCLGVFWVGVSAAALWVAAALYAVRMFAVTAFYHRYFSHSAAGLAPTQNTPRQPRCSAT